jgi:hypothetical protein
MCCLLPDALCVLPAVCLQRLLFAVSDCCVLYLTVSDLGKIENAQTHNFLHAGGGDTPGTVDDEDGDEGGTPAGKRRKTDSQNPFMDDPFV